MKKLVFSILFMAFALSLDASTDGRIVGFDRLPQNAQQIIIQHFSKDNVLMVEMDRDGLRTEFEVRLKDGTEIDFDGDGNLKKIDCQERRGPDALVPAEVLAYVNGSYPEAFITEWGRDDGRWKAELNNGLDLMFNRKYQFVGIDD